MDHTSIDQGSGFGGLRSLEPVMEVGLAVAAAAFTVAIWLSSSAPQQGPAASGSAMQYVTFPPVFVVAPRAR